MPSGEALVRAVGAALVAARIDCDVACVAARIGCDEALVAARIGCDVARVAAHASTEDVEGCSGHPRATPVGVRAYRDDSLK